MSSKPKVTKKAQSQLRALATRLDERRDAILRQWRKTTQGEAALSVASSLTRMQFNDHIPGVLDAYAVRLRSWPGGRSAGAKENEADQVTDHGLQRWQQGYQLPELTRERGHLQMAVLDELETYEREHPLLEPEVMPTARRAWEQLCWDGISDSATQYWRLHQTEANGRVRELEEALTTLHDLDQVRASTWRDAAHDLKGSMSVVSLASSVLDDREMTETQRHEYCLLLHRGVSSLHDMLNDLMGLARLDAGLEHRKIAPFDAGVLLTGFCEASLALAESRGLFLKMSGPDSLPVHGDQAKVLRILQNLLLNALKYTQSGGVTVIWGAGKSPEPRKWMFCVQDTGPGLNLGPGAPLAGHLHDATQTSHSAGDMNAQDRTAGDLTHAPTVPARSKTLPASQLPGEGVGLSIVKRLCELLHASLELETSTGTGSTFRVILPLRYETDETASSASPSPPRRIRRRASRISPRPKKLAS